MSPGTREEINLILTSEAFGVVMDHVTQEAFRAFSKATNETDLFHARNIVLGRDAILRSMRVLVQAPQPANPTQEAH